MIFRGGDVPVRGGSGAETARVCCFGAESSLCVGGVTTGKDFPTKNAFRGAHAGDPWLGSVPNGGKIPVGWGNGDCWLARFRPVK
jgi:hypothetical protein